MSVLLQNITGTASLALSSLFSLLNTWMPVIYRHMGRGLARQLNYTTQQNTVQEHTSFNRQYMIYINAQFGDFC